MISRYFEFYVKQEEKNKKDIPIKKFENITSIFILIVTADAYQSIPMILRNKLHVQVRRTLLGRTKLVIEDWQFNDIFIHFLKLFFNLQQFTTVKRQSPYSIKVCMIYCKLRNFDHLGISNIHHPCWQYYCTTPERQLLST